MSENMRFLLTLSVVSIGLLLAVRLLFSPLRLLVKGMLRLFMGLLGVAAFNAAGGLFGVTLGFNLISGAVVGFLGLPGLTLLLFSRWALL